MEYRLDENNFRMLRETLMQSGRSSVEKYVAAYGTEYLSVDTGIKGRKMGFCYSNAARAVMTDPDHLTYVEGMTLNVYGYPVQHAWTVTQDGTILDPTYTRGRGRVRRSIAFAYIGIPFPFTYVARVIREERQDSVLNSRTFSKEFLEPFGYLQRKLSQAKARMNFLLASREQTAG